MITGVEYMQLVSEEYDLSDYKTKKAILFCNEAAKSSNVEHIVTKLYDHIRNDVTGIDFGSIPRSKGVITNIENFDSMIDCLNSISDLVKEYKDPTNTIKEIYTAIDNIRNRERDFGKAFTLNIECPMMLYNTTVMSIVSAISLMISSSIEFIKNGHDSFTAAFDKSGYSRSKDHLMFEYITQFNRNCANGTIDKLNTGCIRNNITATHEANIEPINEGLGAVGIIIAIGMAPILLFQLIRKVIMFFLRMKMKVSDWFMIQAEYLQINAENLKYREDEKGEDHKKLVYQRQMKWVDRFKKIANFLAVKDSKSRKEVNDEEKSSSKQTYDDDNNNTNNDDSNNNSNDEDLF